MTGDFLGLFHFRRGKDDPAETELGYRLKRTAWGNGFATEGSRALVRRGFMELGTGQVTGYPAVKYVLNKGDYRRRFTP